MFRKDHAMKVNKTQDSVELSQLGRSQGAKQTAAAAKAKSAGEAGATAAAPGTGAAAGIEISGEARALAQANQIAKNDNIDQAKIDRVKAMLNNGTYKPDFGKVADKMMNETLLQDLG